MNNSERELMDKAWCVALKVVELPIRIMFGGWVLTVLWGWFVMPVFALAALTIPKAIGLSIVASCFRRIPKDDSNDTFDDYWRRACSAYGKGVVLLGVGSIVHFLFMQ